MTQVELQPALQDIVRLSVSTLQQPGRDAFDILCLFPPAPNTFAESTAAAVAKCSVEVLRALQHAGLLQGNENGRCSVHALIAAAAQSADQAARLRFADYFANYASAHAKEARALESESANIIAAFDYGGAEQRTVIALAMSRFLELRGDYRTWSRLVTDALAEGDSAQPELHLQRARAEEKLGNNKSAERHARQGLKSAGESTAPPVADLLALLGHVEMNLGMLQDAYRDLTRAAKLSEESPDSGSICDALRSLGVVATRLSRLAEAESSLTRAIGLAAERHDTAALATLWTDIGVLRACQGQPDQSLEATAKALEAARQIGYSEKEAAALEARAEVLIGTGRLDEGADSLGKALDIARRIEHRWYVGTILNQFGNLLLVKGDLAGAAASFNNAIQEAPPDTPDVRAHALFGLARVYREHGQRERAVESATESLNILENMSHRRASEVREWITAQEGA